MRYWILLGLVGAVATWAHSNEDGTVDSRIESIGLFKNGLAVVRRVVRVPGPGEYRLERVPIPVHGTWWIESEAQVDTRVTTTEIEVPLGRETALDLSKDLAGQEVTVHFLDAGVPAASGVVVAGEPKPAGGTWDRSYEQSRFDRFWYPSRIGGPQEPPDAGFIVLQSSHGWSYVRKDRIAYVEAKGDSGTVRRRRPVLIFTVKEASSETAEIAISYVTKGLAWAPSYRLDITDAKKLRLRQKAVLKNELEPFSDAEIFLISGFPSVQFSHVTSPLSLGTTWASFFDQLGQQIRTGAALNVARQQLVMHNAPAPASVNIDLSAVPTGDGVDLYHHPIGRRTMDEGDSLAVDLASAETNYVRVIEWLIPDTRQPNGRYVGEHERRQNPDRYDDSPWDAVRFRNPFDFPMTTGPAMVVADGKFNGQRMSSWVNHGEETSLRVTKSLSIRTRHFEKEMPGEREIVHIGGRAFRKVGLVGEAYANNHRNEDVTLVVRRQFSGKLLAADGSPKKDILESGVHSVNERNELTWEVKLKSGEELKLTYRYEVLVHH